MPWVELGHASALDRDDEDFHDRDDIRNRDRDGRDRDFDRRDVFLGALALTRGDLAEADRLLRRAAAIYEADGGHAYLGLAQYELAEAAARAGRRQEALDALNQSLARGYEHQGKPLGYLDDPAFESLRADSAFRALASGVAARGSTGR